MHLKHSVVAYPILATALIDRSAISPANNRDICGMTNFVHASHDNDPMQLSFRVINTDIDIHDNGGCYPGLTYAHPSPGCIQPIFKHNDRFSTNTQYWRHRMPYVSQESSKSIFRQSFFAALFSMTKICPPNKKNAMFGKYHTMLENQYSRYWPILSIPVAIIKLLSNSERTTKKKKWHFLSVQFSPRRNSYAKSNFSIKLKPLITLFIARYIYPHNRFSVRLLDAALEIEPLPRRISHFDCVNDAMFSNFHCIFSLSLSFSLDLVMCNKNASRYCNSLRW